MRRCISIAAAVGCCLLALTALAAVPNPAVTGPIAWTSAAGDPAHGYPFLTTTVDLASHGYVEEEYFISGTALPKTASASPPYTVTVTPADSPALPYRTRIMVRRPRFAENFNGTAIVEWQNDSAGYNLDALWIQSSEHFMRRGYAWIGVSVQRLGVYTAPAGLKAWSPYRYASLDIANDNLWWDIFSQAVQAIRHPQGIDPMGGLVVDRAFAAGASRAANNLLTYHNAIQPLTGIVDGFVIISTTTSPTVRTDLPVKVFKLLTETDVAGNANAISQVNTRQPDSDHYRSWEVAGASHFDYNLVSRLNVLQARDGLALTNDLACTYRPAFSRIPFNQVANAACDRLVEWVSLDMQPPHGEYILVTTPGPQTSILARDAFGNVLGGVRLAQHEVATATNTGINLPGTTTFCRTFGTYAPFDDATLQSLYRNHGKYVSSVAQVTEENLDDGFIVDEDAESTIEAAAQSAIGKMK